MSAADETAAIVGRFVREHLDASRGRIVIEPSPEFGAYVREASTNPIPTTKESTMSPAEQETRLQCLQLALGNMTGSSGDVIADAEAFYGFVTGKSPASPREKIDAALEQAGVR